MNNKTLSLTAAASSLIAGSVMADYTGLSVETTLYQGEIEELAGTWTARIYANFDADTDQLNSVYGGSDHPLLITSTNGFYQSPWGGPTSNHINPVLIPLFPSLALDSWVTIGLEDEIDNGMLDIGWDWSGFEGGGYITSSNASWFATPDDPQVLAGEDLRVLVGQFTMYGQESRIWGTLNLMGKQGDYVTFQALDQTFDFNAFCGSDGIDCNQNGIPDEIDIKDGTSNDCNGNCLPDECDVVNGNSYDCDQNGVPDECQPDCDGDGWIDPCDSNSDVDQDGIPDNCEEDCNENTIPDHFEVEQGWAPDCNENGILDECDINSGTLDCNENGIPDECESGGGEVDCNDNGVPDQCDIETGAFDCNLNGIPDECEIADGTEEDCNSNGVLDSCDIFVEGSGILVGHWGSGEFGYSVSVDGNVAIVGEYDSYQGRAYIYRFHESGWMEEVILEGSDSANGDEFGYSVSIDGDTAIVGAPHDNSDGGSAYIYRFDGTQWIEEAKLFECQFCYSSRFGGSVSIDGDTVIIGADEDDDNGSNAGAAYIYRFDGSGWVEEAKILPSNGNGGHLFGCSVSIDGDTVVVGAWQKNNAGLYDAGAAYIFNFDGSSWIEETELVASDPGTDDYFGYSVSIDGDTVVVGAYGDNVNSSNDGSAYIYQFDGSTWAETKLSASDGEAYDLFGNSVSIERDTVIVGAPNDDDNGNATGAAYVYRFEDNSWSEVNKLLPHNVSSTLSFFGKSVSIGGNTLIVGAPRTTGLGSAYIFHAPLIYSEDCNANGIPDECDIEEGTSNDVNSNGIPDECEVDCNNNGVPDYWEIKKGTSEDCNANSIPDECDIEDETSGDVNSNGIPDECDPDCNANEYPDDYDISTGESDDVNGDGIPDECQCIADTNNDGFVDINDILLVIGYWGLAIDSGDINNDGIIDVTDLILLIANWGACE